MYALFLTLLRILFPLDPVAQLREATRWFITGVIDHLNAWREELEASAEDRAVFEGMVASAEDGIKLLIHERACQILGLPYIYQRRPLEYPPRRASDLALIIARLNRVLMLQDRLEELAQRRAARMKGEADANPLGLVDPMTMIRDLYTDHSVIIIPREVLHRRRRGRWIATPSSRDGGGCAFPRGPPFNPTTDCRLPQKPQLLGLPSHALISAARRYPSDPASSQRRP